MQNTQQQRSPSQNFQTEPWQGESLPFDLAGEIESLHTNPDWSTKGIARKPVVRYPDFHITVIAMKANSRIEEHHNPGRISVQTITGHIRMHAANQTFDLPKGRVLVLDRAVRHDVEALQESAFLLSAAVPGPQLVTEPHR